MRLLLVVFNIRSFVPSTENSAIDEVRDLAMRLDLNVLCMSETWPHYKVKNRKMEITGYFSGTACRRGQNGRNVDLLVTMMKATFNAQLEITTIVIIIILVIIILLFFI